MIPCNSFFDHLQKEKVSFFAGVPDSLLKDICAYITDHTAAGQHVIAANEGAALALAAGHHLATGGIGLVYLQNSGLGNLVNPLTSLTDPEVYAIPSILLIGWRGEPGKHDEPQHVKQGRVMLDLLSALEIPYAILPQEEDDYAAVVSSALDTARRTSSPFALIVRKGTFAPYKLRGAVADKHRIRREEAVKLVLDNLGADDVVVSTTGMTSREVFEHREARGSGHARDFLTVGCMGHASQIAMGIALAKGHRHVFCLDGDGAVIMHLGSVAIAGASGLENFHHIVINNGAHDSVGGQPTVGMRMDIPGVARCCHYKWVKTTDQASEIPALLHALKVAPGPSLLEIRVNKGSRADLGRPTTTPVENKKAFMDFLHAGK